MPYKKKKQALVRFFVFYQSVPFWVSSKTGRLRRVIRESEVPWVAVGSGAVVEHLLGPKETIRFSWGFHRFSLFFSVVFTRFHGEFVVALFLMSHS